MAHQLSVSLVAMSKAQEAQQFLQDLDNFDSVGASTAKPTSGAKAKVGKADAADAIAFLDEITQKSSEPTPRTTSGHLERPVSRSSTPSLRKSTERVRMGVPLAMGGSPRLESAPSSKPGTPKTEVPPKVPEGGSWGWGSVWSTANTVMQQAKSVVDEQVKNLPANGVMEYAKNAQEYAKTAQEYAKSSAQEYAKTAQEYAKTTQLDKIGTCSLSCLCVTDVMYVGQDLRKAGLSTFTDILNVVAPPISDHEVLQVWLSHDMEGYDGVESVVYKGLSKVRDPRNSPIDHL